MPRSTPWTGEACGRREFGWSSGRKTRAVDGWSDPKTSRRSPNLRGWRATSQAHTVHSACQDPSDYLHVCTPRDRHRAAMSQVRARVFTHVWLALARTGPMAWVGVPLEPANARVRTPRSWQIEGMGYGRTGRRVEGGIHSPTLGVLGQARFSRRRAALFFARVPLETLGPSRLRGPFPRTPARFHAHRPSPATPCHHLRSPTQSRTPRATRRLLRLKTSRSTSSRACRPACGRAGGPRPTTTASTAACG